MRERGINFTEAIEKGWKIAKFKYYLKVRNGKEVVNLIEDNRDDAVNVYGSGGVFKKTDKYLYSGCSVLFGRKGTIGKPLYVNERFWTVDTMYYTTFFNNMIPKLAYYIFSVFPWEAYTTKTALPSIVGTDIENAKWAIPKKDAQKIIVNFLDKKTTEIDELIADKEKLIKLLEEKRQAVITEAVTKGLDPNVKMKDSGVEWIGEIPEHWEVKRLKYLFEITKRIENLEDPDILSVTQKGIKVKDITTNEGQLAESYDKYQTVRVGDFVMNHMDLLTGFIDVSKFNGVTSPDYRVFRIRDQKSVRQYFLYYFQMSYYRKIFYKFGQGVSIFGRWRLPADEFYNFRVPVPTIKEQKEIVKYISNHLADSEHVIEQTKNTINKLKDFRQSLINEAVTGKIDVREMVGETEPKEVSSS